MTPLERAARALCSDDGCYPDYAEGFLGSDGNWVEPGTPRWREYLPAARAVLQAIREPSEHAMDCGAYRLPGIDTASKQAKARDVYRAMIDAALEEG